MDETLVFDELRKVMERKAIQTATMLDVMEVTRIDGYPFNQPDDAMWVNFEYAMGDTIAAEVGQGDRSDGQHLTVGLVQFNILWPENTSKGPPTRLADRIRKMWSLKSEIVPSVGQVWFGGMGQKNTTSIAPKGWHRITCDAPIHFRHRG